MASGDENGPAPATTTPRSAVQRFFKEYSNYNIFEQKSIFRAEIITKPETVPPDELALAGGSGTSIGAIGGWVCFVRILDPRMAHQKFLPPACRLAAAGNTAIATQICALHTKMTIPASFAEPDLPGINDIIEIILEPGSNGDPYDLQTGKYLKTFAVPGPQDLTAQEGCLSLAELFDQAAAAGGGTAAGAGGPGTTHSRSRPAADQTPEVIGSLTIENKLNESVGRKDEPLSPTGITIHYTAGGSSAGAISTLKQKGYSYHFIISRDGTIEQLERTDVQSIHDPKTNATHIGISFVNLGNQSQFAGEYGSPALNKWISGNTTTGKEDKWDPYPTTQTLAGKKLVEELKKMYPNITNLVGHSETSTSGKQDPGPAFPLNDYRRYVSAPAA